MQMRKIINFKTTNTVQPMRKKNDGTKKKQITVNR